MLANITPGASTDLIQEISARLRQYYVYPDIAETICQNLLLQLENGAYEDIDEGEFLAYALTTHLQEINHDQHLWVRWHPDPLPEFEGALHQDPLWLEEQRLSAERENYGFHKTEILAGNVGLMDIHKFHRMEWGGATAVAALKYLAHISALIIDLRQCEGGHPDMVALICSHLFAEGPIQLHSIYWRDEDLVQEYWTDPDVPGPRFDEIPLYLLTSRDTFSAGEQFACDLKAHQRALLIGETTGGGAHPGASYRVNPHFELFVPIGRAFDPLTNQNWEGHGIDPNISVSAEEALKVAHRMALLETNSNL